MNAFGLATCKGLNKRKPGDSRRMLCHRAVMCPSCEHKKAGHKAWQITNRIRRFEEETNGEMAVGVLTLTGPGKEVPEFRYANLRNQYDYFTARTTLPGFVGHHSMRGINKLLTDQGASGGTHFMEFTYNQSKEWWNVHSHTLFWGDERIGLLKDSTRWEFPEDGPLLGEKKVRGRQSIGLQRLGFGKRYSLDYAEDHELEELIRYSSKVAYATKPFKAPKSKTGEIRDFLLGLNGKEPRLARPFGDAIKGDGFSDFLTWQRSQERKESHRLRREAQELENQELLRSIDLSRLFGTFGID